MATQHEVKQGEHLSRIAAKYGFQDYRVIWNHPKNADLAKRRKTPNVLLPGDRLFIPDKRVKTDAAQTGQAHRFRLSTPPLRLRIAVKDFDNQAVPNTDCELEVEGTVHKIKSNSEGLIEHDIPGTAENGKLRIPALGIEIPLKIGHLDPIDEESGCKARLINLGYHSGASDALRLRYAIEEFQCDHGLEVTGEFDSATIAKLNGIHGC